MPRVKKTPGSINPGAPASPGGAIPKAPTGLRYGENKQLTDAQRAVPQGSTPMPTPAGPNTPAPTPAANLAPNPVADTLSAATAFTPPNIGLGAPSANPAEPVTAPITGTVPTTAGRLSQTLAQAANLSGSASLMELAKRAAALGQ